MRLRNSSQLQKAILVEFDEDEGHSIPLRQEIDEVSISPNEYFYTRRPPGEWINIEPITDDEIIKFNERSQEFRRRYYTFLDLWGYFAVPFEGRTGEFLEFFYRDMVRQGKVNDPDIVFDEAGNVHYKVDRSLTSDLEILLRNEAFNYYMRFLPSPKKTDILLSKSFVLNKQAEAYRGKDGKLFVPNSIKRRVRMAPIPGRPLRSRQARLKKDVKSDSNELSNNSEAEHWTIKITV
ncbi:hypothetical protein TRFO_23693 [Tritrichomonas foetus]|uniref:Uncharacterized protein n=1 Tax=Tritrichomonas foetus TaxID=1144522 RepID=A0A1J4K9S4_9EUKA|nr:hypothetical protein TRFO_23693 [Tritrichomonas foetus]|eukprot:OHT07987.1 hypothetical protein TRFO_23693 [Tritrichomonas foetus]